MWKDITTYARNDNERKPTTYEIKSGIIKIVVTCGHVIYRPQWVMHCLRFGIDTYLLEGAETKDEAQAMAIKIVLDLAEDFAKSARSLQTNQAS